MVRQNFKKIKKITKNQILSSSHFDKFLKRKLQKFDKTFQKMALPFLENLGDWLLSLKNKDDEPVAVVVKKLKNFEGELPQYETGGASGLDVRAQITEDIVISPQDRVLVPTGLCVEIPKNYEIQVRPRSGLSFKEGLGVINSPGTIDSDYRGEIKIILMNYSNHDITIQKNQRIAQLVLCPVKQLEWLESRHINKTKRGGGGFGSTGKH